VRPAEPTLQPPESSLAAAGAASQTFVALLQMKPGTQLSEVWQTFAHAPDSQRNGAHGVTVSPDFAVTSSTHVLPPAGMHAFAEQRYPVAHSSSVAHVSRHALSPHLYAPQLVDEFSTHAPFPSHAFFVCLPSVQAPPHAVVGSG
jgi:hypothetical protein